jgi:hypothetical protein
MGFTAPKLMLIRHAEKPIPADSNPKTPAYNGIDIYGSPHEDSLIPQGWQRAGALIKLFTSTSGPLPLPQFLFAPNQFGNGTSKRPYETITPLSQKLGISINPPQAQYSKTDYVAMLTAATSCNGMVLISWEHGEIPSLAAWILQNTNISVPKWPGSRFDIVWVFDLDTASGTYSFNQVPQLLLAGDQPTPIFVSGDTSKTAAES